MSTRLVILGLLRKQPLHGYEIKQIIEQRMGDWTSIAFGSIYFALDKLAQEQLIEQIATEQEGGRPSRHIYQITGAGQAEFTLLLRDVWAEAERPLFAFDLAIFFMDDLPVDEIKAYLRDRIVQYESFLQYVETHREEKLAEPYVALRANAIFDHARLHFEADLTWTKDLLDKVERGEYP
jgi:DNA-binding PadR family transcriptional regulator